jgi:hypothetical protein
MSRTWGLVGDERVTSLIASIPYLAPCPGCGNEAKWEDVLVGVVGVHAGVRTTIQPSIECDVCGPLMIEVDE